MPNQIKTMKGMTTNPAHHPMMLNPLLNDRADTMKQTPCKSKQSLKAITKRGDGEAVVFQLAK